MFKAALNQSPEKRDYIERRVAIELAGGIAQTMKFPNRARDKGDEHDEYWARELSTELVCNTSVETEQARKACLYKARARAQALLYENWSWVEALAEALIARKVLSCEEILSLRPDVSL